jgi:hypothetical protein
MPRLASQSQFTIAQLEQLLSGRRAQLNTLQKQRNRIARKLAAIDDRIRGLGGSAGGGRGGRNGAGGRVRNEKSLMDTIESVLKSGGKAMKVAEIADAVQRQGYRSNSANFRGIVNQTLIKDKRFVSAGRGLYQLKK